MLAVAFTVWFAVEPVSLWSLSCSKGGVLYEPGTRSEATCNDSMVHALGAGPLVRLGLLLAAPPVVAALAMRWWVSWLAVIALAGLSFAGLANWASFWLLSVLAGAPMTLVALIIAAAHLGVKARLDSPISPTGDSTTPPP